jgi:hypothetical protein
MIEWTKKRPKSKTKRIKRSFAFWPTHCQSDKIAWLGFVYLFQYYESNYAHYDDWDSSKWHTETTLSSSQYKEFKEGLAMYLTDPDTKIRDYANLIRK